MISGPNSSGRTEASIITAQPAWQLPTTQGLPSACGCSSCSSITFSRNRASARMMSSIVCPGIGSGVKPTKYAGWPARIATPSSLSALKPPMPGPWPARGSTTTNGRFLASITTPAGGLIRTSP